MNEFARTIVHTNFMQLQASVGVKFSTFLKKIGDDAVDHEMDSDVWKQWDYNTNVAIYVYIYIYRMLYVYDINTSHTYIAFQVTYKFPYAVNDISNNLP